MRSGSIRVTVMGDIRFDVSWLAVIEPLPYCDVEVIDFGDRVNVVATRNEDEVALIADLATGDVAVGPRQRDDDALTEYALTVLRARMAVDGVDAPPPGPPRTPFEPIATLAGADWLPADQIIDGHGEANAR
ncbi:hypothetical protein [Curtobacterium flaccumfaciens]|uniref:hypothetical protein n=1 Tax=Curtobacterium flaccumfaciens TaxID=2035 RepID=UPI00344624FC